MEQPAPSPPSRRERQQQTREALVLAARHVFARDGYHGASLDEIAREAGFSKGAVYSNFDGKAGLFLAVIDMNLTALDGEAWSPFERAADEPPAGTGDAQSEAELVEAMRGVALATLEFIAAAARDDRLSAELASRMQVLLDLYTGVASESRPAEDPLTAGEVGALMAALDQGAAMLTLSGIVSLDQRLLRTGMRRLLDPERARRAADDTGGVGASALHDQAVQRRVAAALGKAR